MKRIICWIKGHKIKQSKKNIMKQLSNCCNADIEQDLTPQGVFSLTSGCLICRKCKKYCGYGRVVEGNSYCDQYTLNSPHTHSGMTQIIGNTESAVNSEPIFSTGANPPAHQGSKWQIEPNDIGGALTPLGESLKANCLSDFSGSIYKHIVYNPHMRNIDAVINQAQEDGKDWQFSHAQPVTEYEWVAVFEKWIS